MAKDTPAANAVGSAGGIMMVNNSKAFIIAYPIVSSFEKSR